MGGIWDQTDRNRLAAGLTRLAKEIGDMDPDAAAGLRSEAEGCRRGDVKDDPRASAWRAKRRG